MHIYSALYSGVHEQLEQSHMSVLKSSRTGWGAVALEGKIFSYLPQTCEAKGTCAVILRSVFVFRGA